jgi:hypothetical protein
MAKGDSKTMLENKMAVLRGAKTYLNGDDAIVEWSYALRLGPQFRNHEYHSAAKALHSYLCDALECGNYSRWLKLNRPEEKRSEKECMIAWAEWMYNCLREDLHAMEEEERRRKNWNPITHPYGPAHTPDNRTIIIKLR